jgi:hypothetical protein
MRANRDAGICGGGLRLAGVSTAAALTGTACEIARMRGLRGGCSPGARAFGSISLLASGFGLKSSSAARRAFLIRSRS